MAKKLEEIVKFLSTKFCEYLPYDLTLYEREGKCINPSNYCSYCRKIFEVISYNNGKYNNTNNLCYKKSYLFFSSLPFRRNMWV